MGDRDQFEWNDLRYLVGEPFVHVRDAERDPNDPADLGVSRSFLCQIIDAAWGDDLCDSCNDCVHRSRGLFFGKGMKVFPDRDIRLVLPRETDSHTRV